MIKLFLNKFFNKEENYNFIIDKWKILFPKFNFFLKSKNLLNQDEINIKKSFNIISNSIFYKQYCFIGCVKSFLEIKKNVDCKKIINCVEIKNLIEENLNEKF